MARKAINPGVGRGKGTAVPKQCVCIDCGVSFVHPRRRVRRCDDCKVLYDAAYRTRYEAEHVRERIVTPGVGKGFYPRIDRRLVCSDCGASFTAKRTDAKRCAPCQKAWARERSRRHEASRIVPCPDCGEAKSLHSLRCSKCAVKLRRSNQPGPDHPSWKGGRTMQDGYVRVRVGTGYVAEHRKVVEERDGPIPDGWHVHHLNGIRHDNRSENLIAMSKSDHHKNHHAPWEERIRALEARVRELEGAM